MRNVYKSLLIYAVVFSSLTANETKDPWKGDEYAHNSKSQKESAESFISTLRLQNISSVLDIGCGDGKITAAIAEAIPNGQVVGIDISPSMIHFAQEAFVNCPNLKFLVQDAAHIDVPQTFDLITSFTVMQWVLEQKLALEGFHKALKPEGRLCIQMPIELPIAMKIALNKTISSEKWKNYFVEFTPPWKFYQLEEYRDLVNESHFTIDRLDTDTKHEKFPSRIVFQGFLKQWFPYLRPIPSDLKDVFLTELLDLYLQILPTDEKGQVSFIVTRLELEAHK
jgi:trans-aconitate 2-methyltransferase